jgi:hypothetical protein
LYLWAAAAQLALVIILIGIAGGLTFGLIDVLLGFGLLAFGPVFWITHRGPRPVVRG